MNFLSHFYFDRSNPDSLAVTGMVLPDLLKNANKDWNPRPERHEAIFRNPPLRSIYNGWKRHLTVDRHFHSSDFFFTHTKAIRRLMTPFLGTSPAKPFFVAHIALELMLDSLLLKSEKVNTEVFYSHLENADRDAVSQFLKANNIQDRIKFFSFLDDFIQSRYLNTYTRPNEIIYALNRICMRVWENPFDETQKIELKDILTNYQDDLSRGYITIFDEIEEKLTVQKF